MLVRYAAVLLGYSAGAVLAMIPRLLLPSRPGSFESGVGVAAAFGGALVGDGSDVTVVASSFHDCTASYGGAIAMVANGVSAIVVVLDSELCVCTHPWLCFTWSSAL